MKKLLLLILPFLLVACGKDKDEPRSAKLDGCYYLSHTKIETRTPVGDGFYNTTVKEEDCKLEFGAGSSSAGNLDYEHIPVSVYFDVNKVYWLWATLPSQPSQADYDVNKPEGEYEYLSAFEAWNNLCQWEVYDFYISSYKVTNGSLYIGKADMGKIAIEPDKFTLDYTYTNPKGNIVRKIFTYTYYPSFNKGDI